MKQPRDPLHKLLRTYASFLRLVNECYGGAIKKNGIVCPRGCHECCTGLFAITLLDALFLRHSLRKYPAPIRKRIVTAANEQLHILEKNNVFDPKAPVLTSTPQADRLARKSAGMLCSALLCSALPSATTDGASSTSIAPFSAGYSAHRSGERGVPSCSKAALVFQKVFREKISPF